MKAIDIDQQSTGKCYACDRPFKDGEDIVLVDTRDGQTVYVGQSCYRKIKHSGEAGYQPEIGGPRLYTLPLIRNKTVAEPLRTIINSFSEAD